MGQKYNLTLDDIQTHPDEIYEPLHMTKSQLMEKIREETRKVISFAIESMQQEDCIEQIMNLPEAQGSDAWKQESNKLLDFVIHELIPSIHRTSDEMTNTISALSGQYINPDLPVHLIQEAQDCSLQEETSMALIPGHFHPQPDGI